MIKLLSIVTLAASSLVAGAQTNLFNANEAGPNLFGAYNVETRQLGVGIGASYFPAQRFLGAEVSTVFYDIKGRAFDNVDGTAILRLPLENLRLAPFGTVGVTHDFNTDKTQPTAGAGISYAINPKWHITTRYERLIDSKDNLVKFGIDLKF